MARSYNAFLLTSKPSGPARPSTRSSSSSLTSNGPRTSEPRSGRNALTFRAWAQSLFVLPEYDKWDNRFILHLIRKRYQDGEDLMEKTVEAAMDATGPDVKRAATKASGLYVGSVRSHPLAAICPGAGMGLQEGPAHAGFDPHFWDGNPREMNANAKLRRKRNMNALCLGPHF